MIYRILAIVIFLVGVAASFQFARDLKADREARTAEELFR